MHALIRRNYGIFCFVPRELHEPSFHDGLKILVDARGLIKDDFIDKKISAQPNSQDKTLRSEQ